MVENVRKGWGLASRSRERRPGHSRDCPMCQKEDVQ